jgi:hypothetical protein
LRGTKQSPNKQSRYAWLRDCLVPYGNETLLSIMKYLTFLICFIGLTACNAQPKKNADVLKVHSKITYLTASDKSGKLLNEGAFWAIIEKSIVQSNNNYQRQIQDLQGILAGMDKEEIVKFNNTFTALLAASYTSKLWGASYVINGGCSDDCFEYFREYLIAHGKIKFYDTYNDPESCADWIKSESEDNWEGIRHAAANAYKQKTGSEILYTYQPEYKLKGKIFDEDTVDKLYPKLAAKF